MNNRRLQDDLLSDLRCPLTLELFEDPITVPCCGKSFERNFITQHLENTPRCPLCNGDLAGFDALNQAKNVVLAGLVETLKSMGDTDSVVEPITNVDHQWICTATPISTHDSMCEIDINLHNSGFITRPSLFIAVLDRSGSMSGLAGKQVLAALKHIESLAKTSPHVKLVMLSYGSECIEIKTAAEYVINGGTNFRAAFAMVSTVLARYICSDSPEDAERANNVSMATIVLMTDGQDGSGNPAALVPEFKEMLAARWREQPIAVHTVGFSSNCDRELLESIRTAGTIEGLYRFAEPGDDDDALCQKLSSIFELSSAASTVPVRYRLGQSDLVQEIRLRVTAARHGSYRFWLDLSMADQAYLQIDSALDSARRVAIRVLPPSQFVEQRWLAHSVDCLAVELLDLSKRVASQTVNLRSLSCALLQKKINSIRCKLTEAAVIGRITYIEQQLDSLNCGHAINVGKMSDLRFASLFNVVDSGKGAAAAPLFSNQTLQAPAKLVDNQAYMERPCHCYSRANRPELGRNELQCAIALQLTDATSAEVKRLLEASTIGDILHKDVYGNNSLMMAAYCGHANTVRTILQKFQDCIGRQLDISLRNQHGESAVTLAIKKRGFHYTLGALLDAGAKIDQPKPLERFAIEKKFVVTAQIIAQVAERQSNGGSGAITVDPSATSEYILYMFRRAQASTPDKWDPQSFLNAALAKQMTDIVRCLITECGAKPTLALLMDYCFPKKPDAADTPVYLELANILCSADPTLFNARTENDCESALIRATQKGSLPHVQFFAERCAAVDEPDAKGNTALWVAAFQCYPCIIADLLDRGAAVNRPNLKGNTPLYGPCTRGNRKVADQLINAGADVFQVNQNGDTLVLICCRNGHSEVLELLLQYVDDTFVNRKAHIDGFNAIMASAEQDKPECIRVLADFGISLDQVTDDDNAILARATPLHIAAYYGRLQAMEMLLKLGANPNAIDKNGQTPLHIAVIQGNVAALHLLRSKGASATVVDIAGNVPMAYARDRADVRKALVDPLLDILMQLSRGGFTKDEEADACKILDTFRGSARKSDRIDVDARDIDNSTPLMQAVLHGKYAVAETLIALGADAHLCNSYGMSSVTWAHWSRSLRMQQLFGSPAAHASTVAVLERLQRVSVGDTTAFQILFLGARPLEYTARTDSGIARRMEEFIHTPLLANQERCNESLLRIEDGKAWAPRKLDNCSLFDACRTEISQRVWDAKVFTINKVASNTATLMAREIFTLCLFSNNPQMYSIINSALLTGNGLDGAARTYASSLYDALLQLPPYVGEAFIGSSTAQRRMYTIGQTFRWRHFASASTLWKVALENAPYFTSIARKGVVFIVKSKTGRLVGAYSQFAFDSEVLLLPDTVFCVTNWYHGDVIALGQANIRQHTFGVKEVDQERQCLAQLTESDKSLIIEITEQF